MQSFKKVMLVLVGAVIFAGTVQGQTQSIFDTFNKAWGNPNPTWSKVNWKWQVWPGIYCYIKAAHVDTNTAAHPSKMVIINTGSMFYNSGGWAQTRQEQVYGSYRGRFKIGGPEADLNNGCVNSFFYWSKAAEIDMEFRTRWQGSIYTGLLDLVIHKNSASGAQFKRVHHPLLLDFNPSLGFHEYGWDWYPNKVDYFIDGKVVYSFTGTASVPVPSKKGRLYFNSFSGNPFWGGFSSPIKRKFVIDWFQYSTCYFRANPPAISVKKGGAASLELDGGKGNAGNLYVVLVNQKGTDVGIGKIPGFLPVVIPVDMDPIMLAFLGSVPSLIGFFDANGKAVNNTFTVPQGGDPALAGNKLSMAYLVIDSKTFALKNASTPLTVRLNP